jgi:exodeoxyribonuclease V
MMKLSDDQKKTLRAINDWMCYAEFPEFARNAMGNPYTVGLAHDYPVFSVGGFAGTGKTTILREVADAFPSAALVTPTHKAAQVLRSKLPAHLAVRVRTFHSLIYSPDPEFTCKTTGSVMDPLELDGDKVVKLSPCDYHVRYENAVDDSKCTPHEHLKFTRQTTLRGHHSLIVVDEASMLTEREVNDLRSFGLPVVLVGDHGQLPPVKAKMNPWIERPTAVLTVNHRQGEASGIPEAAAEARAHGVCTLPGYGSSVRILRASSGDARVLLERYQPDSRDAAFLVQYNKTRSLMNQYFRRGATDAIRPGERLIALERMEDVPTADEQGNVQGETMVFNGMLVTVREVLDENARTVVVLAELDLDLEGREGTLVNLRLAKDQLGAPDQLSYREKPGGSYLWDYAYAITVHKSQGSEFKNVVVWQETPGDKRSLYTAVTRAREGLVILT